MRPSKLSRKSALKPGSKGLARGQFKRTVGLPRVSLARKAEEKQRKKARAAVRARDVTCQFPHDLFPKVPCWQPLECHHRRKDGQGGPTDEENMSLICRTSNQWIETAVGDERLLLIELGWIVLRSAS